MNEITIWGKLCVLTNKLEQISNCIEKKDN